MREKLYFHTPLSVYLPWEKSASEMKPRARRYQMSKLDFCDFGSLDLKGDS